MPNVSNSDEDVRGYGERLAQYLNEKYPVYHIPSIVVDRLRQNATHPEKSDSLDALGVAKAMVLNTGTLLPYTISQESEKAKLLDRNLKTRNEIFLYVCTIKESHSH